jgi:hypothetical protein
MTEVGKKYFGICLAVFFGLFLSSGISWSKSKIKAAAAGSVPGEVLPMSGGQRITLEGGRFLLWTPDGKVQIQEGSKMLVVNLKATPKKTGGAEAMGLDVEETDLGGQYGTKSYLRHKKQPKGRALNPSSVGGGPSEKERGQSSVKTVQGIPIKTTKFPNGSFSLDINWGKTREVVFFDRRNTLIWVEETRPVSGLDYSLKQWADGSFSRRYRQAGGEVDYTYDSIDESYRIIFKNPRGKIVAEAYCDRRCEIED